jgi:ribosomal protein S4E
MRFVVALSTVAMIGLSSSAMGFESASSQISTVKASESIQSLEIRQSAKPVGDDLVMARGGRASGFFGRLMEIERRKNAWLRGMVR